jgi:hypothetical protein
MRARIHRSASLETPERGAEIEVGPTAPGKRKTTAKRRAQAGGLSAEMQAEATRLGQLFEHASAFLAMSARTTSRCTSTA